MINLESIPSEPIVTIINPDGSELISTNNLTTFTYIRTEIKSKHLEGYKVRLGEGTICDIDKEGRIKAIIDDKGSTVWPDGFPGDVYEHLLCKLL